MFVSCWEMEFVKTSKGGQKLIRNNFMYHLNKTLKNGTTYLKCDKRQSGSCFKAEEVWDQQNHF